MEYYMAFTRVDSKDIATAAQKINVIFTLIAPNSMQ